MSLLTDILNTKKKEVELSKTLRPIEKLKRRIDKDKSLRSLKKSVDDTARKYGFGVIAEIKKKSPSMKLMKKSNVEKALDTYNHFDTTCGISVLTDSEYFGQDIGDLEMVSNNTKKPVLRKDFIIDEYQVWEAKAYGADAILLMSSIHAHLNTVKNFHRIFDLARSLDLEVLIEFGMDTPPQKEFIPKDADLFGINSREFVNKLRYAVSGVLSKFKRKDITTNTEHFKLYEKLIHLVNRNSTVIAESGIVDAKELDKLRDFGYQAALIGTGFLLSENINRAVNTFDLHIKNYKRQKHSHAFKPRHEFAS